MTKTEEAIAYLLWRGFAPEDALPKTWGSTIATIMINDLTALMNKYKYTIQDLNEYRPDLMDSLRDVAWLLSHEIITNKHFKEILQAVWDMPYLSVCQFIIDSKLLEEAGEDSLTIIVKDLIEKHASIVEEIKAGKEQKIGFFIGQVMKAVDRKGDPNKIKEIFLQQINS